MLMVTFPAVAPLNVMHLASPNSAILSAVIFNALIIVLLIPLALQRRAIQARCRAMALLRRNLLIYGVGGVIAPFIGIKLIDDIITSLHLIYTSTPMNISKKSKHRLIVTLVLLIVCCGIYPLFVFGAGQLLFPRQGQWQSCPGRQWQTHRLDAPRPDFQRGQVLQSASFRGRNRL